MGNLEYISVSKDSDELNEWKARISLEEKIYLESDLEDYEWYGVKNDDGVAAIFQIISVRTKYSKNLSIYFNPVQFDSGLTDRSRLDDIIKLIIFAFQSIVEICSEKTMKKIKFHTHDELMGIVFSRLAESHEGIKDVRKYGKWVEVSI